MLIFGSCKTNTGIQREACFMSAFLKAVPGLVVLFWHRSGCGWWFVSIQKASKGVSVCKPSMCRVHLCHIACPHRGHNASTWPIPSRLSCWVLQVLLNISYGNNAPNVHLKQLNPYFEVAFGNDYHSQVLLLGFPSSHCFCHWSDCHSCFVQKWRDAHPRMAILHGFARVFNHWIWYYRYHLILSDTIWYYVYSVCFHRIMILHYDKSFDFKAFPFGPWSHRRNASLVMLPTASTRSQCHMVPWSDFTENADFP